MPLNIPSEVNVDVRALVDLFLATAIGEVATKAAMSAAIGAPIDARRWLVPRALRLANAEAGAIFGTVRGEGYKRLPGDQAALVGHAVRRRIRRTSRRAAIIITRAIEATNDLAPDAARKAYAEINTLGLIGHMSTDRQALKLGETFKRPEPIANVIRATLADLGIT